MGTPERAYSTSHPWITFRIDLSRSGTDFWMLLGEARSKVEHLSRALLKPDVAEEMQRVYLAKGAQATTAIEGNTLTEEEVAAIVAGEAHPPPSQEYNYRAAENIISAFNRITDDLMAGGPAELDLDDVRRFNAEVLDGLDQDDVRPGELRQKSVVVGTYRGAPWQDCEYLVDRLCEWLNGPDFEAGGDDWEIPWALIKATIAHLYIAWIHPFDDGNGRTARLMELQILIAAGVPTPAAHLLSNHYNTTRTEYYRQLDLASRNDDVVSFLRYAIQGFVDQIRVQVDRVWGQQYADRWEQFVYETFGGKIQSDAERRRLELVLRLSDHGDAVQRRDLPGLSPELAVAYAGTQRMLARDLNALQAMGLVEQAGRGMWRARREQILGFQPHRRA